MEQTKSINLEVPRGWHELDQKQLRYVYSLIASGTSSAELKSLCLLRWGGVRVIGRQRSGAYLVRRRRDLFELNAQQLAELADSLNWLADVPPTPVRLERLRGRRAVAPDLDGLPFERYIVCDNYYQGYLHTGYGALLDEIAAVLYGFGQCRQLNEVERMNVFYWFSSIKRHYCKRFSELFQPVPEGKAPGQTPASAQAMQEAIDTQIRALTKGDVTKEPLILALDTLRALTELNAQAREYQELKKRMKK